MVKTEYLFTKDAERTDVKADTLYPALSNGIEKCGVVGFGSDGASIIIGHKKVASKLKRGNPKNILPLS